VKGEVEDEAQEMVGMLAELRAVLMVEERVGEVARAPVPLVKVVVAAWATARAD
jgi:hypothetical protein